MAEVLTIDSGDDDDLQLIFSSSRRRKRVARKRRSSSSIGASPSQKKSDIRTTSDKDQEVTCLSPSPSHNSDSSMDSPAPDEAPKKVPVRTRRGIAGRNLDEKGDSVNLDHSVPIYTSQIFLLREKKKHLLEAERDELPAFIKALEVDEENICPEENSERPVRSARSRGQPTKNIEPEPVVVKSVLAVANDDSDVDEILPPPPERLARKKRKTKQQKEQEALLRSLAAARKKYEASKLFEAKDGVHDLSGLDLDVSIIEDDGEKEVQIKFRWRSEITRIMMRMNQRFHSILPKLAELCSFPSKQLLLSVRDTIINPEDTPSSLSLTIADIIDCGVSVPATNAATEDGSKETDEADPNLIRLQLQAKDQKSKVTVTIRKSELLCSMMEQYAEKQGLPLEKLTFKFDGEVLSPDDTPEDLDLEDDFCIDVMVQT